jgi:hypothetical protein
MAYYNTRIYNLGNGDFEAKFSESGWVKDNSSQRLCKKDYNRQVSPRGHSPDHEENRIKHVTKAKGNIRRLVTRHSLSRKWELTFAENIKDVSEADYHFRNFTKRVRRRYPEFKYVATREFQDKNGRGAVHYHLAVNIFIIRKVFDELWGKGFTWMKAYSDASKEKKIYNYITKYLTKYCNDERLNGYHLYICSQGLKVPFTDMFFESKDEFMSYLINKYPKTFEKYIRFYEEAGLLVVL